MSLDSADRRWRVCLRALQEVYQQTHPVFFSDRALYVILYSLRSELYLPDFARHLMNVTIRYNDAPILLVGTHSDCFIGDGGLPLAALKARFPQVLRGFFVQR